MNKVMFETTITVVTLKVCVQSFHSLEMYIVEFPKEHKRIFNCTMFHKKTLNLILFLKMYTQFWKNSIFNPVFAYLKTCRERLKSLADL